MANMSLNLAQAFCEKHKKAKYPEGTKICSHYVKLYTKILLERKEYAKALEFLSGDARSSFNIEHEFKLAMLSVYWLMPDNQIDVANTLLDILRTNYENVKTPDFQSIYNLHEALVTHLVNMLPAD